MKKISFSLRALSFLVAALLAMAAFAGCGKVEDTSSTDSAPSESSEQQPEDSSDEAESQPESQPEPEPPSDPVYPSVTSDGKLIKYNSIATIGDAGYEYYTYVPAKAEIYASLVNDTAKKLSGTAQVYNMIIPVSSGITLPDNFKDEFPNSDMKESLDSLSGLMSEDVKRVELYDTMMQHRNEYIFYRTDHHWTARGAYCGYAEFCKAKGISAHDLSEYRPREFEGFLGTFYNDSGKAAELEKPDVVEVFYPVNEENIKLNFTDSKGKSYDLPIIGNVTNLPAALKYSTFAAADNPYTVIENTALTDGSSLVVVKESFGNALIPFLADHYQTIYELDYRYWNGNVVDFVKQNGVQDVLFANNISMTRSDYLLGKLSQVL